MKCATCMSEDVYDGHMVCRAACGGISEDVYECVHGHMVCGAACGGRKQSEESIPEPYLSLPLTE